MNHHAFYKPGELAQLTRLSPSTLANWRSRGLGPKFIRLGGAVRYWKSDVEHWLEEHKVQTRADERGQAAAPQAQ